MSDRTTGDRVDLGPADRFPPGQPHAVRAAGRDLLVLARGEEFFAVRDACPHQGARLSAGLVCGHIEDCLPGQEPTYTREGELVTCPWHGWKLDLRTGRSIIDPETVRVKRYPIQVEKGHLFVEIS